MTNPPLAPTGLIIAIDGVAGSGKSTAAKSVARHLGIDYLDTGAMYRAVAFAALRHGIDPADDEAVARLAEQVRIEVGPEQVLVDGVDATVEIRTQPVSEAVSAVAANPAVRVELVRQQRQWVADRGCGVVEGRDITTVVLPDAPVKIYMQADPAIRALRRAEEGVAGDAERVAADISRRDRIDSGRAASPLQQAADATVIDTTHTEPEDVVERILALVAGAQTEQPDGKEL